MWQTWWLEQQLYRDVYYIRANFTWIHQPIVSFRGNGWLETAMHMYIWIPVCRGIMTWKKQKLYSWLLDQTGPQTEGTSDDKTLDKTTHSTYLNDRSKFQKLNRLSGFRFISSIQTWDKATESTKIWTVSKAWTELCSFVGGQKQSNFGFVRCPLLYLPIFIDLLQHEHK